MRTRFSTDRGLFAYLENCMNRVRRTLGPDGGGLSVGVIMLSSHGVMTAFDFPAPGERDRTVITPILVAGTNAPPVS